MSCSSPWPQVRAGQVLGLQVTFPWAQEHRTHPELAHCVPWLWICPSCWQNPSAREAHWGQHLLEAIWSTSPFWKSH